MEEHVKNDFMFSYHLWTWLTYLKAILLLSHHFQYHRSIKSDFKYHYFSYSFSGPLNWHSLLLICLQSYRSIISVTIVCAMVTVVHT